MLDLFSLVCSYYLLKKTRKQVKNLAVPRALSPRWRLLRSGAGRPSAFSLAFPALPSLRASFRWSSSSRSGPGGVWAVTPSWDVTGERNLREVGHLAGSGWGSSCRPIPNKLRANPQGPRSLPTGLSGPAPTQPWLSPVLREEAWLFHGSPSFLVTRQP